MYNIYIKPEDVWNYFINNRKVLGEEVHVIAEAKVPTTETVWELCVTDADESVYESHKNTAKDGIANLEVYRNDELKTNKRVFTEAACESEVNQYLRNFSALAGETPKYVAQSDSKADEDPDLPPVADETDFEMVAKRDEEMIALTREFISGAVGCPIEEEDLDDGIVGEILEQFETICAEYGYEFYHPYIFEDEEGIERIIEYPSADNV